MKILIVEDEVKTGAYLRKGLTENGYLVDLANNGQLGLELATSEKHDLVILDIVLPECDGWTIISRMRDNQQQTPVLFLTARGSVSDRVKGLDLGADDYLVKPFAFSELLARIRSLLRRGQPLHEDVLCVADLELDFKRLKVSRAGQNIRLTSKEFSLLSLLAQHAGEIQSRTLIAEQVWDMNFDSVTNVVDVAISRLRHKVDEPFEKKLIRSVRGMGYVLEG
jgi:two-component system copper resistance phosphate regulon response regulator CusR